jgi:ABC-type glycerol-3-phosphate transport system permease component
MWHTFLLSVLAGIMGTNAIPHFVKGITGERFPNVTGNSAVRNAVAGLLGLLLAVLIGYWADLSDHGWAGLAGVFIGALVMAIFHGLGGAYRLNTILGLPNPVRAANRDVAA